MFAVNGTAMYDPIALAKDIQRQVIRGNQRKYYRLARGGRFYGGIAASDCLGCQLKCIFCWSSQRDKYATIGQFYSPEDVFSALVRCARKNGYRRLRISGNEPTLARDHLLEVLERVEKTDYLFILETNGLLIDTDYAKDLAKFKNLHVRVSLKGTHPEEFHRLTGANPEAFHYQIRALESLVSENVVVHPACMLSFSDREDLHDLLRMLEKISSRLVGEFEEESVFLYPHVEKTLRRAGMIPKDG
jgi:uncharacterized Fe-S cluster-containing radical SAM superfamily protein